MKEVRKYLFTPLLLFFILLLDGQISTFLSNLLPFPWHPVSHLLFIFMLFLSINLSRNYHLLLFLFFGLIYDAYYLHMIGMTILIFPLLSLLVFQMNEAMLLNRFTRFLSNISLLFLFEVVAFVYASFLGMAAVNFGHFVIYALIPSLLFNGLLFLILQPVFEKVYL